MLHDTPNLTEARFVQAAKSIFDKYKDEFYERVSRAEGIVLAIAGGSGSGKTSIACILCRLINEDPRCSPALIAKHVYLDNLYTENYREEMPGLRERRRKETSFKGIGANEYNWIDETPPYDSISRIISIFRDGGESRVCATPCVDVLNQQIDLLRIDFNQRIGMLAGGPNQPVQKIDRVNILIMEGLYAIDGRMKADYNFLILGNYFQDKSWKALRPPEFDTQTFAQRIENGDGMSRIRRYAEDVILNIGPVQQQDVRSKQKLTEDRLVILELEHQAIQQLRRDIEHRITASETGRDQPIHFASILPVAD